jgi:hypothetical protein
MKNVNASVKSKLQEIIDKGKENVEKAVLDIQKEFEILKDLIVRPAALNYKVDNKGLVIKVVDEEVVPTPFAKSQLLTKLKFPAGYMDTLSELGEYDLIQENLHKLTSKLAVKGLLLRKVGTTVKGVLSPSYRRMDASPIIEAFISQALSFGFVPYEGKNTDYRYSIRFLLPKIFNPTGNEYVTYGACLSTSDYGASALKLELMILRIVCENGAVGMDVFKHIHIGRRFDEWDGQDSIELSGHTYKLDTQTIASAVKDAMKALPESFHVLNTRISEASNKELSTEQAMSILKTKNLGKEVLAEAKTLYEMPDSVQVLPAGRTAWRLSNVLSLMAQGQKMKSEDQRIDMQGLAMDVLAA